MAGPRSPFPIHYLDEAIGFLVPRSFVPVPRPFVPVLRPFVPYSQIHHNMQSLVPEGLMISKILMFRKYKLSGNKLKRVYVGI